MANLHRFKGYYNTGHFSDPPLPLLFSFFISHSLALRLTPVSVDADILWAFHNPFDVSPSVVMSLFKGFSVVGSALAGFFLEHTMPRSAPVAWDVFGGQQAALAPIRMLASALGFMVARAAGQRVTLHLWYLTGAIKTSPIYCLCTSVQIDSANKESLYSPLLAV